MPGPRINSQRIRTREKKQHCERRGGEEERTYERQKGLMERGKETGALVIGLSKRAPCASSKLRVKRPPWCGAGFLLHS